MRVSFRSIVPFHLRFQLATIQQIRSSEMYTGHTHYLLINLRIQLMRNVTLKKLGFLSFSKEELTNKEN